MAVLYYIDTIYIFGEHDWMHASHFDEQMQAKYMEFGKKTSCLFENLESTAGFGAGSQGGTQMLYSGEYVVYNGS